MKHRNNLIKILFALTLFSACSLFETRTPEEPEGENGIFVPPTTPEIVIDNFIEAVKYKNSNNYNSCFLAENYDFIASNEAANRFLGVFDNWTIENETRYLTSLAATLNSSDFISVYFSTNEFFPSADSVIFTTDYSLDFPSATSDFPNTYAGNLRFTIVPTSGGLWAISKWQDFSNSSEDSLKETWSHLKAYFNN
jgi:hypothetical protein